MLNLEPHYVTEGSTRLEKLMYGPVDIEGHKGLDGRSYIVDTARLFPPAPPIRGVRGCHLYKLLRKELVRSNPVPLSSDAFSFFGKVNEIEHNIPVTDAVNRIFDVLIPQFFALPNINEILQAGGDRITKEIHDLGINVRFLGCILDYAINLTSTTPSTASGEGGPTAMLPNMPAPGTAPAIAMESVRGIVREMIARASKHVFFGSMRTNIRPNCGTKEECRRLAADHWNHLLFSSALHNPAANVQSDPTKYHLSNEAVENWWKTQLIPTLKQRFVFFNGNGRWTVPLLAEIEQAANRVINYDLVLQSLLEAPAAVFARSTHLTGVIFNPSIVSSIVSKGNPWFSTNRSLADTEHVVRIEVLDKRVKFMPFLSASFGDSERFYLAEIANRISALGANHPQVAISYRHLGELYADQPGSEENARASYDRAAAIYRSYHSKDPDALVRDLGEIMNLQADLLLKYDRLQLAQHKLLELLELYRPVTFGGGGDDEEDSEPCASKTASCGSTSPSSDLRPTSLVLSDGKSVAFVRKITAGGDLEDAANVLDKLAFVKLKLGSFPDASNCFALAYECKLKIFGTEQCWQVARTLNGQAQLLFASGQTIPAKEMCIKVHKITIETRGSGHSEVGIAKDNLARVLSAEGSHDDADELYKSALEIKVASLGEKHSFVAMSWDNMASNRLERLLGLARGLSKSAEISAISGTPAEISTPNPQTPFLITKSNVNPADLEDISLLYEKSLEAIEKSLGKLHSAYGISASNLAVTKAYLRQWKLAERLAEEAFSVLSSTLGNGNPSSMVVSANLNYVRGVLSKSSDEQQSLSIESDAMRRVYHSSLASSTPSGGSSSASSNKSRIPDKIKQLLEKKGIAVTEENAAKVQELLRRKREAAMPGATPLVQPMTQSTGFGAESSDPMSTQGTMGRNVSVTLQRKPIAVDPYENAPDNYADLPAPPSAPVTAIEDSRRGQYENYGDVPSAADGYSPLPYEPEARRSGFLEDVRSGTTLRKVSEADGASTKRKSLSAGDYENVPQIGEILARRLTSTSSPKDGDSYEDDSDDEEASEWSGEERAPRPKPVSRSDSVGREERHARDLSPEPTAAATDAAGEAMPLQSENINDIMNEITQIVQEQSEQIDNIEESREAKSSDVSELRSADAQSSSTPSVFERVSAFFSNLIKSSEKAKRRDASQGLSRSSPARSASFRSNTDSPASTSLNQGGSIGSSITRASSTKKFKGGDNKSSKNSASGGAAAMPSPAPSKTKKKDARRKKADANESVSFPDEERLQRTASSSSKSSAASPGAAFSDASAGLPQSHAAMPSSHVAMSDEEPGSGVTLSDASHEDTSRKYRKSSISAPSSARTATRGGGGDGESEEDSSSDGADDFDAVMAQEDELVLSSSASSLAQGDEDDYAEGGQEAPIGLGGGARRSHRSKSGASLSTGAPAKLSNVSTSSTPTSSIDDPKSKKKRYAAPPAVAKPQSTSTDKKAKKDKERPAPKKEQAKDKEKERNEKALAPSPRRVSRSTSPSVTSSPSLLDDPITPAAAYETRSASRSRMVQNQPNLLFNAADDKKKAEEQETELVFETQSSLIEEQRSADVDQEKLVDPSPAASTKSPKFLMSAGAPGTKSKQASSMARSGDRQAPREMMKTESKEKPGSVASTSSPRSETPTSTSTMASPPLPPAGMVSPPPPPPPTEGENFSSVPPIPPSAAGPAPGPPMPITVPFLPITSPISPPSTMPMPTPAPQSIAPPMPMPSLPSAGPAPPQDTPQSSSPLQPARRGPPRPTTAARLDSSLSSPPLNSPAPPTPLGAPASPASMPGAIAPTPPGVGGRAAPSPPAAKLAGAAAATPKTSSSSGLGSARSPNTSARGGPGAAQTDSGLFEGFSYNAASSSPSTGAASASPATSAPRAKRVLQKKSDASAPITTSTSPGSAPRARLPPAQPSYGGGQEDGSSYYFSPSLDDAGEGYGGGGARPFPGGQQAPVQFPGGQMMAPPQNMRAGPPAPAQVQAQQQSSYATSKLNRGYESNSAIYSYGGKRAADPSMWQTAHTSSSAAESNEEVAEQLIQEARRTRAAEKPSYGNKVSMPLQQQQNVAQIDDLGDLDDLDLDEINDLLDEGDASSSRAVPNKGASWGWGAI